MTRLTLRLGNQSNLEWAQVTVEAHHYLHQRVDPRAQLMVYIVELDRLPLGLLMAGIPHATRCRGWWGYPGLITQWQVLGLNRIWLDPRIQKGGDLCRPDIVPGFIGWRGRWWPAVATWAIGQVLGRIQIDRKDAGECGQGWFQNNNKPGIASTLAPLLHWRLCHIEDWLTLFAPELGYATQNLIDIYGFEEDEQMNIRTGCANCMVIEEDRALNRIIQIPAWSYLEPLRELKVIHTQLRRPHNRLRKWGERKKDGKLGKNQGRLGPLTVSGRTWGLEQVLKVQDRINQAAR
ncbi:MAG: hypothetical protein ACREIQ_01405, partial [Nitrospiria bacterium]